MRCLLKNKKSYLTSVKVAFFMRNFQGQVRVLKSGRIFGEPCKTLPGSHIILTSWHCKIAAKIMDGAHRMLTNSNTTCLGYFFTLFIALFTFSCLETPPARADVRTVTVGVYENAPKVFTSESGKPSGIFVDIIEHIAKIEGWNLRYVSGTWAEGLDRLAKGEIDLMPDVAYTTEREKIYSFHKVPVLSSWSQVYAPKGSDIQSILDLNGKRIAVLEHSIQLKTFDRLTNSFGLNVTLISVPDYKTEFEMVAGARPMPASPTVSTA